MFQNVVDLTIVNRLIEGKSHIEEGWRKGSQGGRDLNNGYCALDAIGLNLTPANRDPIAIDAMWFLHEALPRSCGYYHYRKKYRCSGVWQYNDSKTTTIEDMLTLFDKAIELARAEAYGGVRL
jgi:hypothetical protein